MRFCLLDRIVELEPGVRVTAIKRLRPDEDYLKDHFPRFPVMPGVLMLEAMTQASAWLIRATEDFRHSIVVLKEARNIKYGSFVEPGQTLRISAEIIDQDDRETRLKTQGLVGDQSTVSARLTLVRYNLADTDPAKADNDAVIIKDLKSQFAQLRRAPLAPAP